MATETLTCKECGGNWDRQVKRGRKPTVCPDCKNGVKPAAKTKPPADPETLNAAERKYKQRVQMAGKHFKPLGDGKPFKTAGGLLMIYKSFETDEGTVEQGTYLREKGMQGRYRFKSLAVREDGTAYANLVGVTGTYEGKYRAIGVENLRL